MKTSDRIKYIELFDIYNQMLTKHQINVLKDYLFEDYSMTEIAQNYKVSKSNISDLIKRSLKQLKTYDSKLKLTSKISTIKKQICNNKKSSDLLDKIIRG